MSGAKRGQEIAARARQDDGGIETAHENEREPRFAIVDVDQLIGFIHRGVERAIPLPRVERQRFVVRLDLGHVRQGQRCDPS